MQRLRTRYKVVEKRCWRERLGNVAHIGRLAIGVNLIDRKVVGGKEVRYSEDGILTPPMKQQGASEGHEVAS